MKSPLSILAVLALCGCDQREPAKPTHDVERYSTNGLGAWFSDGCKLSNGVLYGIHGRPWPVATNEPPRNVSRSGGAGEWKYYSVSRRDRTNEVMIVPYLKTE